MSERDLVADKHLRETGGRLARDVEAAIPPWVERSVERIYSAWRGDVPVQVRRAATEAGVAAAEHVGRRLQELLSADLEDQPINPLQVLREAVVYVAGDQLSLAIGKEGQNVRLAAKLTGWKIDIVGEKLETEEESTESTENIENTESTKTHKAHGKETEEQGKEIRNEKSETGEKGQEDEEKKEDENKDEKKEKLKDGRKSAESSVRDSAGAKKKEKLKNGKKE